MKIEIDLSKVKEVVELISERNSYYTGTKKEIFEVLMTAATNLVSRFIDDTDEDNVATMGFKLRIVHVHSNNYELEVSYEPLIDSANMYTLYDDESKSTFEELYNKVME